MNKILLIIDFIRVRQWIKNLFIIVPFVMSLKFLELKISNYFDLVISVFSFCLISSAIYIINDICDIEEDKNHPQKKNRALTSGKVSILSAVLIVIIFSIISIGLVIKFFNHQSLLILLAYCFNSILYSLKTKHFAIFDVMFLSMGFVLRVLFGIFCFVAPISKWIILLTFTICLFLAFIKRRKDFLIDGYVRKSLNGYNLIMLDKFIVISSVLAIACYVMYVNEMINVTGNYYFLITNVFVIFGIFRYLQILHLESIDVGDPSSIIYKDKIFLMNLVLWGCVLLLCLISNNNLL